MERVLGLDGEAVEGGHTGPKVDIFFSNFPHLYAHIFSPHMLTYSQIFPHMLISSHNILIHSREQGLRNAFEAMDSDQDGYVTLSEFKQLMTK